MTRLSALSAVLILAACGGDPNGGNDGGSDGGVEAEANWVWIEANVVNQSCALSSCHGASSTNGEWNVGTDAHAALVGVASDDIPTMARIQPGDPTTSYLVHKLEGTHGTACTDDGQTADACGQQMPRIGDPLPDEVIQAIKDWITAGATK